MGWIITLYIPERPGFGIPDTGQKTRSFDRPVVIGALWAGYGAILRILS